LVCPSRPLCYSMFRLGKLIRRTHYLLQLRRPRSPSRAYRTTSFIQSMSNWYGHLLQACNEVPFRRSSDAPQFAEFKRIERDHAKEKQKLVKDKDAG